MKSFILPVVLCFGLMPILTANEVRVEARSVDKSPKVAKPKPTKAAPPPPKAVEEARMLEIKLTNSTRNDYKGLKVLALFVTRVRGESQLSIEKTQELSADLPPGGKVDLQTKPMSVFFTPAGYIKGKRTSASGSKFVGHGVQVYNGETLLGEVFAPPNLKAVLEATPAH